MRIRLATKTSFQASTLGHLITSTDSNYLKLLQIYKVISLLKNGASDEQFAISDSSANLFASEVAPVASLKLTFLSFKSGSPEDFWGYLGSLHRPIVFFRRNIDNRWESKDVIALHSPTDTDALKIIRARVETPINIDFSGLEKVLRQLFFGRADEARTQELHQFELSSRKAAEERKQERHKHEMRSLEISEEFKQLNVIKKRVAVLREIQEFETDIESAHMQSLTKQKVLSIVDSVTNRQNILMERLNAAIEITNSNGDVG